MKFSVAHPNPGKRSAENYTPKFHDIFGREKRRKFSLPHFCRVAALKLAAEFPAFSALFVFWPRGSTGVQRYGCIPRSAAEQLARDPPKNWELQVSCFQEFWGGENVLRLVPASLPHALGYACTFYAPTSPPPSFTLFDIQMLWTQFCDNLRMLQNPEHLLRLFSRNRTARQKLTSKIKITSRGYSYSCFKEYFRRVSKIGHFLRGSSSQG